MPALCAEAVCAGYGRAAIINDITLAAERGTVTTIIGPNGAGKSTFVKTLVGILRPMSGRIVVNDVDITRMPGHQIPRHGLVYVPQNDNVFKRLTVRENLEVGGFASRTKPEARMAEIFSIFTDLDKAKEKKAGFLSGGQQNLLAIARALMVDPAVVLLDEPTAGLSPAYTDVVWARSRVSRSSTRRSSSSSRTSNEPSSIPITSTSSWPAGTTCTARRTRSRRWISRRSSSGGRTRSRSSSGAVPPRDRGNTALYQQQKGEQA